MAALLLGVRVSKDATMSNWENPVLTDAQIQYAAIDAWVSLQLFLKMKVTHRFRTITFRLINL